MRPYGQWGSSSLKFVLFDRDKAEAGPPERLLAGRIERIGLPDAGATVSGPDGQVWETWPVNAPDLGAAAEVLIALDRPGSRPLAGRDSGRLDPWIDPAPSPPDPEQELDHGKTARSRASP